MVVVPIGIPGHEFPQPTDLVLTDYGLISNIVDGLNNTDIVFFQSTTFIMVGQIPVQFGK